MTPPSRRLLALLVVALVALSGCTSLRGTENGYIPGTGGERVVEVGVQDRGDPINLTGETLEGEPLDLADYRGGVTIVNVWWSACGPCRTEMPMLVEASAQLDAEIIGINIQDTSPDAGLAFQREFDVNYPSIYGYGGKELLVFGRYAPNSMPSTILLDRDGRVAALVSGPIPSERTLKELVEKIAADDG